MKVPVLVSRQGRSGQGRRDHGRVSIEDEQEEPYRGVDDGVDDGVADGVADVAHAIEELGGPAEFLFLLHGGSSPSVQVSKRKAEVGGEIYGCFRVRAFTLSMAVILS